jgi:nitronate monooxygenase
MSSKLPAPLRLPVIASPMFLVSNPALVIAQCTSGIVGSFPALNARPQSQLEEWLAEITEALAAWDRDHPDRPAAPFAVNQIVHGSNPRWEDDLASCERFQVPIIISSLGAREDVNTAVRGWGGMTLHDVIDDRFARKAIQKGASGLIAVAAGAGGHAGRQSPFALLQEIRSWFDGPLVLSGAIATGRAVLAAQAAGADLAYIGSAFIATTEANAADPYKAAIVEGSASDIVYSDFFSGVHGNYLRSSIVAAGLDPDALPTGDLRSMNFESSTDGSKAWRDIWGSGQGIGAVTEVQPAAAYIDRLAAEYEAARAELFQRVGAAV